MGVIHMIVNGAAKAADLCAFTLALHRHMSKLNFEAWWEYVPSQSNISDGGSRTEGIACQMAADAHIPLKQVEFNLPPEGFPFVSPSAWDDWWHQE